MIRKSDDYDQTTAFGVSGYKTLPKGGYVCRIMMAEEAVSSKGRPMLHIAFDIIEGDYTGYFMNLYQSRKKNSTNPLKEVKWPFEGQAWITVNDYEDPTKTSRKFKGFCTAVEDSGTEIWNLDGSLALDRVKDAEVGVIYQRVEREYNGNASWQTLPWGFRSIEAIATEDFFVPDDKPLPQTYGTAFVPTVSVGTADSFSAAEDDIPF